LGELPDYGASNGASSSSSGGGVELTTGGVELTTGGVLPTTGVDTTTTTEPEPHVTTGSTTTEEPKPAPLCAAHDACDQLDVLLVIDNSGTMGEEQDRLADSFPAFVALLRNLRD